MTVSCFVTAFHVKRAAILLAVQSSSNGYCCTLSKIKAGWSYTCRDVYTVL